MLVEHKNILRKAREYKDVSLETVAAPAKISAAHLHKLERGGVDSPSPRVLVRLAVVLEVSYPRLMELPGTLRKSSL
jgi:HTH-type transcriptional regulator, competence development regulator